MFKIFLLLFSFVITNHCLIAQATNENGDYIVDFAPFSPPEQDLMREMLNKPALNFMSTDLEGDTHTISNYEGSNILIVFWSVDNPNSKKLFEYLDLISKNKQINILSYCYEDKAAALTYLDAKQYSYPIMTQGKFIGEMGYGHGLGLPRMLFIDKNGTTKDILPASAFNNNPNLYPVISDIISKAY